MARDLAFLIPEVILLLTIVFALIAEMLRRPGLALGISLLGLALACAASLNMLGQNTEIFDGTYRIDKLSIWAKIILLPTTALALLLARSELKGGQREGTVYVLVSLVTLGSILLSGAGDTMLLVLGLLLSGLASFALVAWLRDDAATEAAMKLFVFASVTGAIMIFGLSYWFAGTGSTLLSDLPKLQTQPIIAIIGLIAILIGLGYKASLAPFHFWAPDAYQGAPVSIAAYLSIVPKIGAIFALAQTVRDLPLNNGWQLAIAAIAILSMTWGYLAALVQDNIVRLLAYSSIAQAGYFLLGIIAIGSSPLALEAMIIFAAAYAAMNLGAFAVVMVCGRNLDHFTGLGRRQVGIGIVMVISLLSLTGIPPLAGFVGKFLLLGAALDAGYSWLAIIAILNSVLSLAVYLRIIVPMYQTPNDTPIEATGSGANRHWVLAISLALTLIIGLAAQLLLGSID